MGDMGWHAAVGVDLIGHLHNGVVVDDKRVGEGHVRVVLPIGHHNERDNVEGVVARNGEA